MNEAQMTEAPKTIELGPKEEAERLWKGAVDAFAQASDSLVALCESLDLGIRAAEIEAFQRLHPVRDKFPGTIALQLEEPQPAVDVHRDAEVVSKAINMTEILDLLSEDGLACVAPKLHRGWEDRRLSCARSRATATQTVGFSLDHETRERLLLLTAYRNRIFRCPPPIRIDTKEILEAFPALVDLVEKLKI